MAGQTRPPHYALRNAGFSTVYSSFHVNIFHDQRKGTAPKRTNLVKGTDSLISEHLLGDGGCRALSQLDFDLKMQKRNKIHKEP